MSKKSRKLKKAAAAAAGRKSVLGLKKTEGKVKKEALIKAISEKSVSLTAPPVTITSKKKKKKRHGKKAANVHSGIKLENVAPAGPVSQNREQRQGENVPVVDETGKGKKKRKRNKKKRISSEASSIEQKPKVSLTVSANPSDPAKESGKSRKRRNRKRKAAQEVAGISKPLVESVNPSKKVRMEEAEGEALSSSEPELIHADWGLGDDSGREEGSKAEDDSEADLDASEEDIDETPHSEESADDSDADVEINDTGAINKDGCEESKPGNAAKKPNLETKKLSKDRPEGNKRDDKTLSCRAKTKKFSLLDKTAILKEMRERVAEFDSRCLYVAPIPGDCTFDMLKKFIPKMKSCRFFTRPKSNKLRTFVFVEFADAEIAGKEKLSISGRLFAGQSMRAEIRSSQQHGDNRVADGVYSSENIDFSRILVTGLAPGVNQTDLKRIFPTAENIRLPMSQHNFNYGYAILSYVSDAVALDAFSQCHRLLLKGHPISVNFAFKPSEKKQPASADTASSSKSSVLIRPQKETQLAQRVGKVVIQPLVNAKDEEGDNGLAEGSKKSDSLKPTRIQRRDAQKSGSKARMSKDKGTKGELTVEEAKGDDVARTASASLLSDMIKQAKGKIKAEEAIEVQSDEDGEEPDDDKDVEVEDISEEGGDDGNDEDDDTDEGESDGEDKIEEVASSVSASASDDDNEVEEVDVLAGDDSEGETIDASLTEVLKARRACAKALKSPGAKRNWKVSVGEKRTSTMPKMLPVPDRKSVV